MSGNLGWLSLLTSIYDDVVAWLCTAKSGHGHSDYHRQNSETWTQGVHDVPRFKTNFLGVPAVHSFIHPLARWGCWNMLMAR
jgi:hypothetical protein